MIFDFQKIKEEKEREEQNFTYQSYIDDLEVVRANFSLLPLEHQHVVFQQTSHLLIELIRTAIKEKICE